MLTVKSKCPILTIVLENCKKVTSKTFHRKTFFTLYREFVCNVLEIAENMEIKLCITEAYLEPCQTSAAEFFCENS